MRKALLAAAVALGLGFGFAATSGAEAATLGTNVVSAIGDVAKSGAPVAEKTYWRHRRYWGHRHYWGPRRHYYWRHRSYRRHHW